MKKLTQKQKTKIILSGAAVVGAVAVILIINFILNVIYANKFYPGVKVAGVNISRLNKEQAEKIFQAKIQKFNSEGQKFFYQNKYVTLYTTTVSAADPDLNYEIVTFNLKQTLDQAYQIGRGKNFFDDIWQKMKLILNSQEIKVAYSVNQWEIKKILKNNFKDLEKYGRNPGIGYKNNKVIITKEKLGLVFDYQQAVEKFKSNLANLNFEPLELKLSLDQPDFKQNQAEFLIKEIKQIIGLSPIQIYATTTDSYGRPLKKNWNLSKAEMKKILELGWDKKHRQPKLIFNRQSLANFLSNINQEINRPVKEAKFKIANNRVVEFQASQPGQEINILATLKNFEDKIIQKKRPKAEIIIAKIEPQTTIEDINSLGIKSLIGSGSSDFSGSPKNRRHNIKVGTEALNGLLIAPGEKFSLNKALGKITPDKGYLPELVIKGNRTVPEYGGGLCQIGTTMFRLAINSGLPIIERKNHAYRVVYYEPAGTDATIYSPHPDVRFVNDTPNYLLLQTHIKDNSLIFEFWGTDDGRQVATTTPRIFNIRSPGPTKYIETPDLEPQKVKCIESAHNGADAEFTRTITYSNGEVKKEIWKSHYRPWQAVCLVGVEPNKAATSTSAIIKN